MRICVFQSSYEGSGSALEDVDKVASQPAAFATQHTFENRFIRKSHAREEIAAAVAEGFDFYFNFMWGTLDDPVAGAMESRYLESLGLPSCGIHSTERLVTKNDFYNSARRLGAPRVPGNERFPLFVKPANGCSSMLIDDKSVCHDEHELQAALDRINGALKEARLRRAEAMGIADAEAYAESCVERGRRSDDVVVQEYVDGVDYTCDVIRMGDACIALTPCAYAIKERMPRAEHVFLTFELKFDGGTRFELLRKGRDASLFERLQGAAIEAFRASACSAGNMGASVDLRARADGEVFAIEANPQPAAFLPDGPFQDLGVQHCLPGGHSAAADIFIANYLLTKPERDAALDELAEAYNGLAPSYDDAVAGSSNFEASIRKLADAFDYSGTVFDLACGTGIFGRVLRQTETGAISSSGGSRRRRMLGFDISPGMVGVCRATGQYEAVHVAPMETALTRAHLYAERVDHIVCLSSLQLLRGEMFTLVLVLCFALAERSITVSVDQVPDEYNENLDKIQCQCVHSVDHLARMEALGEPTGWKLTRSARQYSWTSPKTKDVVHTTYFRFDRIAGASRDIMYRGAETVDQVIP